MHPLELYKVTITTTIITIIIIIIIIIMNKKFLIGIYITVTTICNHIIFATIYTLEIWFVSDIQL